ncbi:MAG: malate synthase A [Chromatiales bacterium 21-64-14]|nr:MAG: malate synthase A [Chromatiales bacterium 21-64-14]
MAIPSTRPADGPIPIRLTGKLEAAERSIFTPQALAFIAELDARFEPRRAALLSARAERQQRFDGGEKPEFLAATRALRAGDWKVAPVPGEVTDRRVEITGPVDRKMIINALNSGARVFMSDFEDSLAPTWRNVAAGQANLYDTVRRTIAFRSPEGKDYHLNPETAVLMVRPRGLHLLEKHTLAGERPVAGALLDFGLYVFHIHEAEWWRDVFVHAEDKLGLARGTFRATVLIETLPAAFEMDEILYALREHILGLNCGRWDYIFSFIKKFRRDPRAVLPDRSQVTMTTHFLRSYSQLLIATCHRRGAFAMGGMAAQIPIKNDSKANEEALAKVRADKEREAGDGHDGTWVAHPGLVPLAREVFDRLMPGPNQLTKLGEGLALSARDLLEVPQGQITERGLRTNVRVALHYLSTWLGGNGCVPIDNLMEDAATAEISRAQLWQWRTHGARLDDGRRVDAALIEHTLEEELAAFRAHFAVEPAAGLHSPRLIHRRFPARDWGLRVRPVGGSLDGRMPGE